MWNPEVLQKFSLDNSILADNENKNNGFIVGDIKREEQERLN